MCIILIVTVISRKRITSVTVMEESKEVRLSVWERGYWRNKNLGKQRDVCCSRILLACRTTAVWKDSLPSTPSLRPPTDMTPSNLFSIYGNSVRHFIYKIYGFISVKKLETSFYVVRFFLLRNFKLFSENFKLVMQLNVSLTVHHELTILKIPTWCT